MFSFYFLFFLEMLSFYNFCLSCCNLSLFLPPVFTEDGEQFINLFSDLADAMLEENYDLVFLFLSHFPGPHPKHTAIYSITFTSLRGNKENNNLTVLGL